ncbi:holin/antiholin [Caulobacter phage Seuss]|uniref:Holin/antiholin n=1 Tax=Caulobacter phage Seuss TaxID=1675601 RepID=A0A0K1LMY8_9CAUD|nr:holin/antiholin [Caulobacter phage Seuss]AKU43568.1 holin/antiholin [Caulobacter phage Seuss]
MHQVIMPIIDRMIDPLVRRLDQQDQDRRVDMAALGQKIDKIADIAHQIAAHDARANNTENRLADAEESLLALASRINIQEGRNQVIVWLLGLVGAPLTVMLVAAGIAKLFNIKFGGG